MGLVDRMRTLAVAVSATALIACSSGQAEPEPLMLEQEVTTGQEVVETPTIEGEVLEYAVRQSSFHRGRITIMFNDLLAQEPSFSHHEYEAQFFIMAIRDRYRAEIHVGVIHLRDESHEIDMMVYQRGGFPSGALGNTRNVVHYHEFGGPYYQLRLVRGQEGVFVRGGPDNLDQDSLVTMYIQFFAMYNATMHELRVQNRIMDDYRASQAE